MSNAAADGVKIARERGLVGSLAFQLQMHAEELISQSKFDLAYSSALEGLRLALDIDQPWAANWSLAELVTIDGLRGAEESAFQHAAELRALVAKSGATLVTGPDIGGRCGARCHALVSDAGADEHFSRALDLADALSPFDRARSHLLYGEWLRRHRRRVDARPQLRTALEAFQELGLSRWEERARSELRASGERARARAPSTRGDEHDRRQAPRIDQRAHRSLLRRPRTPHAPADRDRGVTRGARHAVHHRFETPSDPQSEANRETLRASGELAG